MKTFDEIYEELQNSNNKELNNAWKEAQRESKRTRNISLITCIIIDIIAIMILGNRVMINMLPFSIVPIALMIFVIDMFVVVIVNFLFGKNKRNYYLKYKEIVVNTIMNNFYNNLEYFPLKPMPEYIYQK